MVLSSSQLTCIIITGIILLTKTFHFYKAVNRKKLKYWLYFSKVNVMQSRSEKSLKAKKLQNLLTLVLLMFTMILSVLTALNRH